MKSDLINPYVKEVVKKPIPDNRGERFYTEIPQHLDKEFVDGKYHLIFVAYYADPHIIKKAIEIKKTNRFYLTIIAGCIRDDAAIEIYFDQAYEYENFSDFYQVVLKCTPWAWHAVTPYYHAAMIVAAGLDNSKLIFDIVDPALFVHSDQEHFDVKIEKELINFSDAVVHKLPEKSWKVLQKSYQTETPGWQIYAYPSKEFFRTPPDDSKLSNHPHIVYAGGIIPYDIAISRGYENHVFDDLIEIASEDSFDLTIYVNQNAREMPWHQHQHYYDIEKTNNHFFFKKGLPYNRITSALSDYSAGIFYDNLTLASYDPNHFRHNMASKLFTYLEAGLPIIVYEEAEMMADIVIKNGLGAVYSAKKPESIVKAVKEIENNDYTDSIERYRSKKSMAGYNGLFLKIYGIKDN